MDFKKQFDGMPDIPEAIPKDVAKSFDRYLIFETEKQGSKHFVCTACGEDFHAGSRHMKELMTSEEMNLWHIRHNDDAVCPYCGASVMVKNRKMCNMSRFSQVKFLAVVIPVSHDDVWVRCIGVYREYFSDVMTRGRTYTVEWMRYHMTPGNATFWKKRERYDAFLYPERVYSSAFTWCQGVYTESYDYTIVYGSDMTLEDTFLRYNGYEDACHIFYNLDLFRYLSWYAKHPQVEMLAKMKHRGILNELIMEARENTSLIDWNAKKPWELYRLPRADYNEWMKRKGNFDLYKVYRRIHGKGAKDFDYAKEILDAFYSKPVQNAYHLIATAKKMKADPREIIRYIRKVQQSSMGGCHMCPGITMREAADLWCDYIELAEKAGQIKTISPMPKDLKDAHDRLVRPAKVAQAKKDAKKKHEDDRKAALQAIENAKNIRKRIKPLAEKYKSIYKKVDGIYKEIAEKYCYENEQYKIIAPSGIEDIIFEGEVLSMCIRTAERYYKRIESKESFLLFLRKASEPNIPYYVLEIEPGGTIRQKRTYGDDQNDDILEATEFLKEWQAVIAKRLSSDDKALAKKSRELRNEGFRELREKKTIVHTGYLRGQLLADVLEADLLEVEFADEIKTERKVG